MKSQKLNLPKLIAISGSYGSGKTIQVSLLVKFLSSMKLRTKIIHVESPTFVSYLAWQLLVKLRGKIPRFGSKQILNLWLFLEIACLLLKIIFVNIMLKFYDVVIAESYLLDSVVNIAVYHLKDLRFIHSNTVDIIMRFIPKKSIIIYLKVDVKTLTIRRLKRQAPNDTGINGRGIDWWARLKKPLYDYLALKTNTIVIDGRLSIPEVHKKIVENIEYKYIEERIR